VAKKTYVGIDANNITAIMATNIAMIDTGRYANEETAASGINE
jgi:hypothetical protein